MTTGHLLVVGGSRGLGRVLATQAQGEYERVSVLARKLPEEPLAGLHYRAGDVTDADAVTQDLKELAGEGGAFRSIALVQRFRGEGDNWQGEIATTLSAARNVIEAGLQVFDPDGGAVVAMSSIASQLVLEEQPPGYHVARAGLEQLVRYYAVKLGGRGIRVNAVSSGSFLKPEAEEWYRGNQALSELHAALSPIGRIPRAAEVASVLRFLLSPAAACVTGQTLMADGGISLVGHEAIGRALKGIR